MSHLRALGVDPGDVDVIVVTHNHGDHIGGLLGAVGWAYAGNPWLGLVVAVALAANTVVSVVLGGSLPLVLKRLGVDPALASAPILTTVTDMCGFFLALSLAALLLAKLV